MQIVTVNTSELKEYQNNPRNNDEAVGAVAESIKQFGFKVPIVIDNKNVIVCGHTRLKAAERLGIDSVPCIVADDLNDEQIKAFRLADNKTGELAEWDFEALEKELAELTAFDVDMSAFGFDESIFDEMSEPQEVIEDDVPEVDEENEPITKQGDIWELGKHRLICGDSTNSATVERLMEKESADLLLTDPPYNVAYEGGTSEKLTIQNDNMTDTAFYEFLKDSFTAADNAMKEGAVFYIWHADSEGLNFRSACKYAGWKVRQCLVWNKNALVLGRQDYQWKHEPCLYGWKDGAAHKWYNDRSQTTVLEFNKPLRNGEHPTMKPVELITYQIKNSTKENDLVLDLFGGSGTTLIASEQTGRRCRMAELDPKYCDVIIKRWENLTGQKAERIESA